MGGEWGGAVSSYRLSHHQPTCPPSIDVWDYFWGGLPGWLLTMIRPHHPESWFIFMIGSILQSSTSHATRHFQQRANLVKFNASGNASANSSFGMKLIFSRRVCLNWNWQSLRRRRIFLSNNHPAALYIVCACLQTAEENILEKYMYQFWQIQQFKISEGGTYSFPIITLQPLYILRLPADCQRKHFFPENIWRTS